MIKTGLVEGASSTLGLTLILTLVSDDLVGMYVVNFFSADKAALE